MRTNTIKQKLTLGSYYPALWCYIILLLVLRAAGAEEMFLKTCNNHTLLDCPPYSLCTRVNDTNPEDLKCICLQTYEINTKWQEAPAEMYCITSSSTETGEANKIITYMRSAANPHHLVFGITMVLLAVTLITAVLYGIKVLRPIKRAKVAYKRLKNRRQNITPLQEMDELEINRRYEMETYKISS